MLHEINFVARPPGPPKDRRPLGICPCPHLAVLAAAAADGGWSDGEVIKVISEAF